MTILEFCLLIHRLKQKHKLSNNCITAYLTLIHTLLPQPNSVPYTWPQLEKILEQFGTGFIKIHICECIEHVYTGNNKKNITSGIIINIYLTDDKETCPFCQRPRYNNQMKPNACIFILIIEI